MNTSLSVKKIYFSALLMGGVVFTFQALVNRWLSVALGATTTNQFAILCSNYLFFGLGAMLTRKVPFSRGLSHAFACVLLGATAFLWPDFTLWLSSQVAGHELRFLTAFLILAPFFFLFGMAIPQFTEEGKEVSFTTVFWIFHLGAALLLLLFELFWVSRFGIKSGFWALTLVMTLTLLLNLKSKRAQSDPLSGIHTDVLMLSFFNGLIHACFLYLNNRVQGPFSITFTFYLTSSIIALSLAALFSKKKGLNSLNYRETIKVFLPLSIVWCFLVMFLTPYFFSLVSGATPIIVSLSRFLIVFFQFFPSLFIMSLLIPSFVHSGKKDFEVIAYNTWGNFLGIILSFVLMTFLSDIRFILAVVLTSLLFLNIKGKHWVGGFLSLIPLIGIYLIPKLLFFSSFRFYEDPEYFYSTLKSGRVENSKNIMGNQVDILRLAAGKTLVIDGYKSVLLKNTQSGSGHEALLGRFQESIVPDKKRALVLGVGSGATIQSITSNFEEVEGVEIHPVVMKMRQEFSLALPDLGKIPNLKLIFDDGHSFLSRSTDKYDLIVNNVPTPQFSPASTLWTKEFYRNVRQKLTSDGIYSQWIDGAINLGAIRIILSTLKETFNKCYFAVVTSTYGNVLCSNNDNLELQVGVHPLVFPIFDWQKLNFSNHLNTLNKPWLEHALSPFLTKAWFEKKDWFLLDLLRIGKKALSKDSCRNLSEVKIFKNSGVPDFCETEDR